MTKSSLCRAYICSERWAEAGEYIRQLCRVVPKDHPDWIHTNWGYACILVYEEKLDEAEACCNGLLTTISKTKVLKSDNPRVVAIAEILLKIFQLQGREHDIVKLKERFPRLDDKEVMQSIDYMPLGPLRRRTTQNMKST
ncbi:hypothetical protein F5884DRAFT_828166 [Xylogone sp. PMI_703]|nr:hypothetical protein F5884DRAFT_828166 [Xylogone sp. PMI_703]